MVVIMAATGESDITLGMEDLAGDGILGMETTGEAIMVQVGVMDITTAIITMVIMATTMAEIQLETAEEEVAMAIIIPIQEELQEATTLMVETLLFLEHQELQLQEV